MQNTHADTIMFYEPLSLELQLPWVEDKEKEEKFQRLIKRAVIGVIIFFVIMQFLPVFTLTTDETEQVKTTLILEPREEPKPPEPVAIPEVKPEPIKKVATIVKKKAASVKPKEKVSIVTSQGLDALSSQLASLTGSVDMQKMRKKNVTRSDRGNVAETSEEHIGKNQITQRSAGVVIDDEIMHANVAQLSEHQTAEVEGLDFNGGVLSTSENYGELRTGMRDMESIRRSLEAARSRVYAIYQRRLTEDPNLSGKFMFTLIIEPNGSVSELSLLNSELGIAELEQEILNQIKQVNFGQDDVIATTVNYTFIFLPS